MAVPVPVPAGRQNYVAGFHGSLFAVHEGVGLFGVQNDSQDMCRVAMGRRHLAGQDHLVSPD